MLRQRPAWAGLGGAAGACVLVALLGSVCACSAYDAGLLPEPPSGTTTQDSTGVPDGAEPGTGGAGAASPDDGTGGAAPDVSTGAGGKSDAGTGGQGVCGDGIVAGAEKCDTGLDQGRPGACPSECPPLGACTRRALNGSACQAECVVLPETCADDDDCCPGNCTAGNDNDCSTSCGDGVVQSDRGETCEAGSSDSPCPEVCDDGDPCTEDRLTGSAANCNAECTFVAIEGTAADGCCPDGANANVDEDCTPSCGNGVREGTEECDGAEGCDSQCKLQRTPDQQRCLDSFANDECERCACLNCTMESLACRDSGDASLDASCNSIVACARASDCVGPVCYCGTADILTCIAAPNGPCIAEIQAAAGTTDSVAIETQRLDGNTAVGRSDLLGNCSITQCPDVCP